MSTAERPLDTATQNSSDSATPDVRIQLLGGFTVTVDGREVATDAWPSRKAWQVVALLALAPDQQLPRDQVLDLLWPNLAPEAAADSLYHALLGARRMLDPKRTGLLKLRQQVLSLRPAAPPQIDVLAFESAAAAALHARDREGLETALSWYSGDLLPEEPYADWTEGRRQALRETRLSLLSALANLHEQRGDWTQAIATLEEAIAAEPSREESQAAMMRVLARSGQRAAALRQYAQLREVLRDELDADPDPQTQQLYHSILANQFPSPEPAGTNRPPESTARRALPHPLTSLIGRDPAVAALRTALKHARLITLTGPGGVGKTRLALAVAETVSDTFAGGVALADLSSLTEGVLVPATVAGALGVREETGRPVSETLIAALTGRHVLLLMDNCEHLTDACARLALELLAACPDLRVLATSRAPLQIDGELRWPVPPLPVPSSNSDLSVIPALDTLMTNPSVQLFVDRARFVRPTFTVTAENASAVFNICVRLDGLPLALELAAARIAHLSAEQIAVRLDNARGLLAGSSPTTPQRQRTLRATLDWSVALLEPAERALFDRLSVFSGGWTLAAAEAVCADDDLPVEAILPLLAKLVDQSLVQVESGPGDDVRFRLLEPVRQHAAARLAQETNGALEQALRARHARCFLALAEASETELLGPGQPVWLARLEAEHDNLREALGWAQTLDDASLGLRLASALTEFWTTREHGREGRRWLDAALSLPGGTPAERASVLSGKAFLAWRTGDFPAARAAASESLRTIPEGPSLPRAIAERVLGMVAAGEGDVAQAKAHYSAALTLLGPDAPVPHVVDLLNDYALLAREQGDVSGAVDYLEQAQRQLRLAGSPGQMARTLINLAFLAFGARDFARAGALLREALPQCRSAGAWRMAGQCLLNIGWIALQTGDYAEAATAYADAVQLVRSSGSPKDVVAGIYGLALVAREQGALYRSALLEGATTALRETYQCPLTAADRSLLGDRLDLSPMKEELGDSEFASAWATGSALTLESAIATALTGIATS